MFSHLITKSYSYFFILLLMSLSLPIFAQNNQDVLVLKNGDKIVGSIFEQKNESIKIRLDNGDEVAFKLEEIETITNEKWTPKRLKTKKGGYYNISTISLLSNIIEDVKVNPLNLHTINGYRFNSLFGVGLGAGINTYKIRAFDPAPNIEYMINNISSWSIYANVSGDMSQNTKLTGIYALDVGVGSAWAVNEDHPKKFDTYYGFSLGIKMKSSKDFAWICAISYQVQYLPYSDYPVIPSVPIAIPVDEEIEHDTNFYYGLFLKTGFYFDSF